MGTSLRNLRPAVNQPVVFGSGFLAIVVADCSGSLMGGGSALIVTIERAKRISQTPPERLKSERVWAENGQNLVKCPMTLQMLG